MLLLPLALAILVASFLVFVLVVHVFARRHR